MPNFNYELVDPPTTDRAYELWLQHAAGFILFEDVRRYAMERLDPNAPTDIREAVQKGIDEALYGLMMVIDGVSGDLSNPRNEVTLRVIARHAKRDKGESTIVKELDLFEGDGMCMGYHGWLEGDFGRSPVATAKPEEADESTA